MSGDTLVVKHKPRPHFEVIPVVVGYEDVSYQGYIRRLTWTRQRAMGFGLFVLVVIYFFGMMSWLNPVTHYLVPPIWVIGGPWGAYKVFKMFEGQITFRSGIGKCPRCHSRIKIHPHQSRFPFTATCPSCRDEFNGHCAGSELPASN